MRPDGHKIAPNPTNLHLIGWATHTRTLLVGKFITGSFTSSISESLLLTTFSLLLIYFWGYKQYSSVLLFSIIRIFLEGLIDISNHENLQFCVLLYQLIYIPQPLTKRKYLIFHRRHSMLFIFVSKLNAQKLVSSAFEHCLVISSEN